MRSPDVQQLGMFSYVSAESRVPTEHPIRRLRALVGSVLAQLDTTLAERYAEGGRRFLPSGCCGPRCCRLSTASAEFVAELKARRIKAHLARNTGGGRRSAVDGRTAAGTHYAISQQVCKRIEQGFGWAKTVGPLRKLPLRTLPKVHAWVSWTFATYNLIRLGGIGQWWDPAPA